MEKSDRDFRKQKVLFLCTGNSARSQMGEALLRHLAGERFEVFSAGLEPKGIHPMTRQAMQEAEIDISNQTSKSLKDYLGKIHFGYLITVCKDAEASCPIFPGMGKRLYWPFEDPAAFSGSQEEKFAKFREIRDQIERKILDWLEEIGNSRTE